MNSLLARLMMLSAGLAILCRPVSAADSKEITAPENFDVPSIDRFLADEVHRNNRVGLSVVIVKNGETVLAKGYGKRSLWDSKPVDPETMFAIGSVSKQFTCACILLLAEQGKLSVNDQVAKYYPNLTRASDITLLDLMNHASGYPDYYPLDFVDRRLMKVIPPDDLIREYAGGKLDFDPGTKWSYSNTGFILLGRVVERVSGMGMGEFLESRIFKPLQMSHSAYEPPSNDSRLAQGYTSFALSGPEAALPESKGWLGAAGGIWSTPGDLATWDRALMNGKVLKPESYELMTTARVLSDGKSANYGCGLGVSLKQDRKVLTHGGAVSGFNTYNAFIPSTKSALIITANIDGGVGSLPGKLLPLLLKEQVYIPKITGLPAADEAKKLFMDLQAGKVDRSQFGEEFNFFLTDQKLAGASERLKPLGTPHKAELLGTSERGGMEVSTTRLIFKTNTVKVLIYRKPDGKVEQVFVDHE